MAGWSCSFRKTQREFMTIQKEVIDIIIEQLGVDVADVTLGKSFVEDLNADSLDLTELIMTFEERFGFEISEEDAEKLKTVGDVVDYIEKRKVNA
jgi:acyl carrier protein